MAWGVEFTPHAARQFKKLERPVREAIASGLGRLLGELDAKSNTLTNVKKLLGRDEWRLRVGDFRVIFTSEGELLIVTVVQVGNRRDVYG